MIRLSQADARALAVAALVRHGMPPAHAGDVAAHLVDAMVTGHAFAGLPRVPAIVAELVRKGAGGAIRVTTQTPVSATIDGGDVNGYVVSLAAADKAIEIASTSGIAVVGACNTWFSGRLAYYVERMARAGFVAMHTANTTARVAPFGGAERILGTNPVAFAFPCGDDPVVLDIGTSGVTWGEALLRQATGRPLDAGTAVDAEGRETTDPAAALAGAFLSWGGPRGSCLAFAAQLFGMLAGSDPVLRETRNSGFFFLALKPDLLMPAEAFETRVAALRDAVRRSRPAVGHAEVRMPGDRSQQARRDHGDGDVEVDPAVHRLLLELARAI
ncbi:L-2-hydroxycarboxylate dehydrogenase (NAD+) [Burkholderiales bacterium]|nr:L-2-hydroxycarboxylate dehydrogenase (NAD+) [Burkholderiales bacterium]